MSFSRKDLTELIINISLSNGEIVHKQWLIQGVIGELSHKHETDADVLCRQLTVAQAVDAHFRKIKLEDFDPAEEEQLILDGFDRVQKCYVITREDEALIVPIELITDEEIYEQLIARHESAIVGHQQHIEELTRYVEERKEAKQA